MFSLAICKAHQIIGLSEHLHADAFPFPFVLAPSLLEEILKGRAGSRERAEGFFAGQCHSGPAHFPVGLKEVSGSVPGLGLVELLPGVSVVSYWPQSRVANTLRSSLLSYGSCEAFQCLADHRRRCQHRPNLICASHWGSGYKTYQL